MAAILVPAKSILSAVGLYGVLSYLIAQRRAAMGIRMALGADRRQVCRLVFREGLGPAVLGLAAGLLAGAAVSRTMQSVLFGVEPGDWRTFLSVAAVLLLISLAACAGPAWRAACTHPMDALRCE